MANATTRRRLRWRQLTSFHGIYIIGMGGFLKIGWSAAIGHRIRSIE